MKFTIIIPARYASTRLAAKPLLDIVGKPMIQRVYEAASRSSAQKVIIATDDQRIFDCAKSFSAEVCLTSINHISGTDRLQEVVSQLELKPDEIVVNVQGDEPLIAPELINQVAKNLSENKWASVATLCEPMEQLAQVFNPNQVKALFNNHGEALYFSRAPIPWSRDLIDLNQTAENKYSISINQSLKPENYYRHIGLYAYRVSFLHEFVTWQPSRLELSESLEQLRALSNGKKIHLAKALCEVAPGVDTREDLDRVRQIFESQDHP